MSGAATARRAAGGAARRVAAPFRMIPGRRSVFVVLVAAVLAPLLIVTTPEVARAAETIAVGPTDKASVKWDSAIPGAGAACSLTGYLRLNDANIHTVRARIRCQWGPVWEWDDSFRLEAYGEGSECRFVMASTLKFTEDTDTDIALAPVTLHATGDGFVDDPNCNVTAVRVILAEDGKCGSDNSYPDDGICGSASRTAYWALGKPPGRSDSSAVADDGSCPLFAMSGAPVIDYFKWEQWPASNGNYSGKWSRLIRRTFGKLAWKPGVTKPTSTSMRILYGYVVKNRSTGVVSMVGHAGADGTTTKGDPSEAVGVATYPDPIPGWYSGRAAPDSVQQGTDPLELIGIQVYTAGTYWDSTSSNTLGYGPRGGFDPRLPQDASGGDLGLSDRGACRLYFGPRIATAGVEAFRDPVGPLTIAPGGDTGSNSPVADPDAAPDDPGDPDDGECEGFSLTDPTSWAGAGICLLVKMIKAVVDVLGDLLGLVGGLVPALLDGINALFVPNPSSWGTGDLKDQLQSRPPGSLVSDSGQIIKNASSAYTDSGGGCGDLASIVVSGRRQTVGCEAVSEVNGYSVVRLLVGVFFGVLTTMAIFSMLGRSVRRSV